jgi:2-C-methyl-D-erythritol 4-phosphate cytidylyltransferase
MNSIEYIEETYGIDDDSIILTHDSVRPFVTHRIIEDNIEAAIRYGACDTVIPATDTIVESVNGRTIESIPVRDYYYQGQTPQSFNIKKLFNLITSLTEEESNILTDACKIFTLKDEDVYLVEGEVTNIKITYPYDLKLANTILGDKND